MPGPRKRPPAPKRLFAIVLVLAVAALAMAASVVACTTSSSTEVVPTTGILIRAETLTSDRGCGQGPTQLLKYAVVLYKIDEKVVGTPAEGDRTSYTVPLTSNVFDCFADGTFVSLPATRGNATYRLEVFAYNDPSYRAASAEINRAGASIDAAGLRNTAPTWTTVCMATQQANVQALANCDPLRAGLSGLETIGPTQITLETQTFTVQGRTATCGSGVADAGGDAALPVDDGGQDAAASDAGFQDAATEVDAGPLSFAQVKVQPRIRGAVVGPVQVLACPAPYVAEVTAEPASYDLDVDLLDLAGNPVGAQTVCTVTSQTGQTSSAVCP